ncbi:HD domain-containing protein [Vallitalea pronyensis]|uniref:HD domain-containing protein n=1 Tax=Vallitalea pronyensis TaxID=1348613 RepID=A0A8J8SJ36_9FIRM|nr:HD domain-containing phosphohydrolase [Vallitalea pronyensis]QUI25079.1 HD domain-containing protein [Vallitalea pronyensis]
MMNINLNELLLSLSYTLDFVEMDVLGVTSNHSKRVAYIANRLALFLGSHPEERYDLVACAILHDNGVTKYMLEMAARAKKHKKKFVLENVKEHCTIGQKNIENYPFLTDVRDVIKYHHEAYDGSGFFGVKGMEIPMMSQLIFFGDYLDNKFNFKLIHYNKIKQVEQFIQEQANKLFAPEIVEAFMQVSQQSSFWLDLSDNFIEYAIKYTLPEIKREVTWCELQQITEIFSRIIDNKSEFTLRHSHDLANKVEKMARYYKKDEIEVLQLKIAANLHDLGKLAISNEILDKPDRLKEDELYLIRQHTYFSRICLSQIEGFEELTEWACNHHEKLDGSGYPFGLKKDALDFNSRLIMCLDIYQALMEERPYREGLSHEKGMSILRDMVDAQLIDGGIVEDVHDVFKSS